MMMVLEVEAMSSKDTKAVPATRVGASVDDALEDRRYLAS